MSGFREQIEEMLPETIIHTLQFDHQEGVLEITFAELRDQSGGVGLIKTIALERELFASEVADLESSMRDLIDEALVAIRNDDVRQQRLNAAIERSKKKSAEDDDDESG